MMVNWGCYVPCQQWCGTDHASGYKVFNQMTFKTELLAGTSLHLKTIIQEEPNEGGTCYTKVWVILPRNNLNLYVTGMANRPA